MAYQALYRKYRPASFSDVVGQEHITETLKNSIKDGKTVHAYLFTGTRGTGKTSCAKILAKAVNCLNLSDGDPCCECEMCKAIAADTVTDIVEIDAASNRGIDSIRELRDQVAFPPAVAKYRVYIIDEVHMLTQEAFNALLKTLEEPPSHVIFILATTEVHKLPATILSRCQRYDFRRIDSAVIENRLKYVAKSENLNLSDEAATLISGVADGGMRDALSILDLCASAATDITEDTVISVCSMAGNDYLLKMADYIKASDTESALLLLDELHKSSVDMERFVSELIRHFRDILMIKTVKKGAVPVVCSKARLTALKEQAENFEVKEIIAIINILQNAATTFIGGNARVVAEMAIIRLCEPQIRLDAQSLERRISVLESGNFVKSESSVKRAVEKAPEKVTKKADTKKESREPENSGEDVSAQKPLDEWQDIIFKLQTTCPLMAGLLNGSKAYVDGNRILIDTQSEQFKEMYGGSNPTYREAIKKAAEEILGKQYSLGPYKKPALSNGGDPLAAFAEKLKQFE